MFNVALNFRVSDIWIEASMQEKDLEEILDLLQLLQVDTIHRDWTRKVWDEDFQLSAIEDLSLPYDSFVVDNCLIDTLEKLQKALKKEIQSNKRVSFASTIGVNFSDIDHEQNSDLCPNDLFKHLPSKQIEMRRLLALLSYLFELGRKDESDECQRTSLVSISIYYLLLSMRGSSAYLVFVDSLFIQSLGILKYFSSREMFNELSRPLINMQLMLSRYKLKGRREIIQNIVEFFIEIASLEPTRACLSEEDFSISTTNPFILCYQNLRLLMNDMHGSPFETIKETMSCVFPIILGTGKNNKVSESIRTRSISFVALLTDCGGTFGKKAVVSFIQLLCLHVEDKVDSRKRATDTIFILLRLIPNELLLKTMKWLMLMTFHNTVSLRSYALEIVTKIATDESIIHFLMSAFDEEVTYFKENEQQSAPLRMTDDADQQSIPQRSTDDAPSANLEEEEDTRVQTFHGSIDIPELILGTILGKMWDAAPSVRARCMGSVLLCLTSNVAVIRKKLSLFLRSSEGKLPHNNFCKEPVDICKGLIDNEEIANCFPDIEDFLFSLITSLTEKTVKERKQALELLFKIIEVEDCFLNTTFVKVCFT